MNSTYLTNSNSSIDLEVTYRVSLCRELSARLGYNDKPIEVLRGGTVVESYLSTLRVGEIFCFASDTGKWYSLTRTVTVDRSRDKLNPTLAIGGLEVLQAPPTVDRTPLLEVKTPPKIGNRLASPDVEDVEFKDS